jgi:multidrug efflux pump
MKPFDAALKGASEIGFTIISLTVSLVAVLIPLLFMGDVVGRLFREFAVSLAVTIVLSAVVALTLVPMLAARLLRPEHEERRFALVDKAMHQFRPAGPCLCPRAGLGDARAALVLWCSRAAGAHRAAVLVIPKNLFPTQDTGQISATVIAAPMTRSPAWRLQQQVAEPAEGPGGGLASASAWTASTDAQPGRMLINLKPIASATAWPR